ncbi:hypothetical protein K439DRAFT_1619754 [Ramaria rubella]|nr:hypothetical protein K439DRAFT_1619754 [Ramaria rubella]
MLDLLQLRTNGDCSDISIVRMLYIRTPRMEEVTQAHHLLLKSTDAGLGRLLTPPEAKDAFKQQQRKLEEQMVIKESVRQATEAILQARELQRALNAPSKIFHKRLAQYIHKDDLIDIAVALSLDRSGTIKGLKAHSHQTSPAVSVRTGTAR